jgi:predicted dienelactone hydrolase
LEDKMSLRTILTRTAIALGIGGAIFFGGAWALSTENRAIPEVQVGFRTLPFDVAHRDKPLDLHIWYPTDANGPVELVAQNALFYGFHAQRDVPARAGAHPLVVLSHGSGGRMTQMAWLATALSARGYIVAGVNHHGTTSMDSDPHRTIEIWDRPADLSAIIDAFAAGPIAGITADLTGVTSAGFSLGGHSAMALAGARVRKDAYIEYCAQNIGQLDCGWLARGGVDFNNIDAARYEASFADARITATIAIDPALPQAMTGESLAAITHPTLFINLEDTEHMPAGISARQIALQMPNAAHYDLPGSWHMSGIGECSMLGRILIGVSGVFTGETNICGEAERHRTEIHQEILELVLPFMEKSRAGAG